jgi:TfoX/Sxy family transcriptional regulator of competence genes
MGTSMDTIASLLDRLRTLPGVRARKMFGEYALYLDDKVVALVCDDQLFVKITPAGRSLVGDLCEEAEAYPGARPSFLIDADEFGEAGRLCELIRVTAAALPARVRKGRKDSRPGTPPLA